MLELELGSESESGRGCHTTKFQSMLGAVHSSTDGQDMQRGGLLRGLVGEKTRATGSQLQISYKFTLEADAVRQPSKA